jgi:hypothetical protein
MTRRTCVDLKSVGSLRTYCSLKQRACGYDFAVSASKLSTHRRGVFDAVSPRATLDPDVVPFQYGDRPRLASNGSAPTTSTSCASDLRAYARLMCVAHRRHCGVRRRGPPSTPEIIPSVGRHGPFSRWAKRRTHEPGRAQVIGARSKSMGERSQGHPVAECHVPAETQLRSRATEGRKRDSGRGRR